jgi:hypothetical protein
MLRFLSAALLIASATALATPRVANGQAIDPSGEGSAWYAGIGTGWYFPIQQWPTNYRLGGGGTLFVGRSLGPRWALQLDANQWLLSGSARSTWDFKAGPMLKWTARTSAASPFVLAGVGFDAQTNYPSRQSTSSAMIPVGLGFQTHPRHNAAIFIEAMHYFVARPVATRDIPLLLGFQLGV